MRKKNPKYKAWLKKRLVKLGKNRRKRKQQKRFGHNAANPTVKNIKAKSKKKLYKVEAPCNFSIKDNPKEVIPFFDDIVRFTKSEKENTNIFFDMSAVSNITADAIIYLLAVIKDLQGMGLTRHNFLGNLPTDPKMRCYLEQSGFLNYVKINYQIHETPSNQIQIISNNRYDQLTAKQICDFVCVNSNCKKTQTKFLYVLITEMMLNTWQHAYNKTKDKLNKWYLFIQNIEEKTLFTFLDIGQGIPKTVRTKWTERLFPSESSIVESALKGEFRTQTGEDYRGKGLPKIAECVKNHNLEKLFIISNKAYCKVEYKQNEMVITKNEQHKAILGTIYYWEINIKGVKND